MCRKVVNLFEKKFKLIYFWFIVALNFQTAGMEMDLNDGLFSQNSHCGYFLKPEILRNRERCFDPDNPYSRDDYHPLQLSIKV